MGQSGFERIDGMEYYTIRQAERMPEFLMSAVSSGDHWMFLTSLGGLTAGRRDAEGALFPYETVDKLMADRAHTGSQTRISVDGGGRPAVWEPFAAWTSGLWKIERSVSKARTGHVVGIEEQNLDLGLRFRYTWSFSHRYGFVRHASVSNEGSASRRISLLDGFRNLMNGGVTRRLQTQLSCLADAYKDNVLDPQTGLAAYSLASAVTDRAEPREALTATVAWSVGPGDCTVSLSGDAAVPVSRTLGRKGDYLLHSDFELGPGEYRDWYLVADVGRDHGQVAELRAELGEGLASMPARLEAEGRLIGEELEAIVGAVDGLSASELPLHEWHHTANALFNAMRGGYPVGGLRLDPSDLLAFVRQRNRDAGNLATVILEGAAKDERRMHREEAVRLLDETGSADLARLVREYVPLSFSRRHGDPSRPWNEFSIRVRDEAGAPVLDYQGNWRDIFQNWEALGRAYPAYLESFITIFLDATTVDGYNPYRISRSGVDWEREDPEDPWSNIGYWNDHQLIYLQKLVESYKAHFPGALGSGLCEPRYSWADVPYRMASYEDICRNPRATVSFDAQADARAEARVRRKGGDGRLVHDQDDTVVQGSLLDKVVSIYSAKLGNFVPGGGVWMNTQRPEWNDANNALAGYGLSMVTAMYMRRFAAFWLAELQGNSCDTLELAEPLAVLVREQLAVMDAAGTLAITDAHARRRFMDAMGLTLQRYRPRVYADGAVLKLQVDVEPGIVERWLSSSLLVVEASIHAGLRPDGLYDAYSLLSFSGEEARVARLYPMLEGQVAALSSGLLGATEAVSLMAALRSGPLYCEDRKTWLLYPDRDLPDFFAKNSCPQKALAGSAFARRLLGSGRRDILYRDDQGAVRFAAGLVNEAELALALDRLEQEPDWAVEAARGRHEIESLYEATFRHSGFTGRSGAMYAYEGLGSVYWHMVAKLLLALAELREKLVLSNGDVVSAGPVQDLERIYLEARDGIGYQRSPEAWGAFPFDPYSHTPKGGGARQPGMTGQVKEELLTRIAEFGLAVQDGCVTVLPTGLLKGEFLSRGREFTYYDALGHRKSIAVGAGQLALCVAGVPFLRDGASGPITVTALFADGRERRCGDRLDTELSASIFRREGIVTAVRVSGGVTSAT